MVGGTAQLGARRLRGRSDPLSRRHREKSWIFRFTLDGRAREMGLGPVHTIPLADARKRAAECRRMRIDGIDPIKARNDHRGWKKLEAAKGMTFDSCAAAYLEAHKDSWKNATHRKQWRNTLSSCASPV